MASFTLLGLGILFFIIAGFGYVYPFLENGNTISQYVNLCSSGIGQFGKLFSSQFQGDCSIARNFLFGIYGLGLIGIILIIIGSLKPSSSSSSSHRKFTFVCSYCNYVSSSERDLLDHKSKHHLDESPYKCEHCNFIGITEEILRNHYNSKHPNKKKW